MEGLTQVQTANKFYDLIISQRSSLFNNYSLVSSSLSGGDLREIIQNVDSYIISEESFWYNIRNFQDLSFPINKLGTLKYEGSPLLGVFQPYQANPIRGTYNLDRWAIDIIDKNALIISRLLEFSSIFDDYDFFKVIYRIFKILGDIYLDIQSEEPPISFSIPPQVKLNNFNQVFSDLKNFYIFLYNKAYYNSEEELDNPLFAVTSNVFKIYLSEMYLMNQMNPESGFDNQKIEAKNAINNFVLLYNIYEERVRNNLTRSGFSRIGNDYRDSLIEYVYLKYADWYGGAP